jgi:hypothetical protein
MLEDAGKCWLTSSICYESRFGKFLQAEALQDTLTAAGRPLMP